MAGRRGSSGWAKFSRQSMYQVPGLSRISIRAWIRIIRSGRRCFSRVTNLRETSRWLGNK
jgi:hypothetical protein